MIPRSQFRKKIYGLFDEEVITFATDEGVYESTHDRLKKISERKDVTSMAFWYKKFYMGAINGDIILNGKTTAKRQGPIQSFTAGYVLYDVSRFIGEYMIHQTSKPCSPDQEFTLSPTPLAFAYGKHFVALKKNALHDLSGNPVHYFNEDVDAVANFDGALWTIYNHLLRNPQGEVMAELPPDSDQLAHNKGKLYYLRGTPGIERLMLENKQTTQLLTEHNITCFALSTQKVRRPLA